MNTTFDAIVIGAGQAGPSLAVRLASSGLKTALIEREHLGGTCVNDGCIPTKTLVASARAAHVARHAAKFGVNLPGPISVDMKRVKARKDAVVAESVAGLTDWVGRTANLSLIRAAARFTGPHQLDVDGQVLEAPKIFINVGGRATLPDWPGIHDVPVLTNTSMMALDTLPEHLLIVGGSYVGLEFAQMYRRFGSKVTVIEHGDRLIAREDGDVSKEVQAILEREGVKFLFSARDAKVSKAGDGQIQLTLTSHGSAHALQGSHLLAAVGRQPNTENLGLQSAGIETDKRGFIKTDEQLRTNVEGVWALGDVNGRGAFTHTSYNDFEIVAANLFDSDPRRTSDRIPAYALFIDPRPRRPDRNRSARQRPAGARRRDADEPRRARTRTRRN